MEFRLLGPLQVAHDGVLIEVGAAKVHALLTALLLRANAVVSADRLIEDLWGYSPPATAVGTLQTYVARLRRVLEPADRPDEQQRIVTQRPGYRIRVERDELDIARFDELVVEGRRAVNAAQWAAAATTLRQALALWRGPAVAEFAHEPFGQLEAARLEEARVCAIEDRIAADLALGGHAELVGELEVLIGEHPLREKLRGQLMVALYRAGRQAEALRAYGAYRRLVGEELGIEPSPELRRLEEAVLLQEADVDWAGAPPIAPSPVRFGERASVTAAEGDRPTLPVPATSYVAPDHVRTVQKLLETTRVLTLTGMGGIGKTRLAGEVAAAVLDDYEDIRLVELAPVGDPRLLPQQVLAALGAGETRGGSVQTALVERVAARKILVVLDNCEHLVEATARLVDALVSACPNLRVLVTSRERLRLPAETVWAVPPLSVPPSEPGHPLDALAGYPSVKLFLDRATSAKSDFSLTEQNGTAVAEICRRLDGIPLALELAAARTFVLSPQEIAARLDDRFRLLTHGSRVAPPRHRTLRAAIDWTYESLSEEEERVFVRSSVFAGGFDLEGLERVAGGPGVDQGDVLEALGGLVDKSLVLHEDRAGRSRYGLLETLREFGAEKLAAGGEEPQARRLHLEWALSVAGRGGEVLSLEHDNLRAALAWVVSGSGGGDALRLASALSPLWDLRAHYSEGRHWVEAALASAPDAPAELRAGALHAAAGFALAQSDYAAADALERRSLSCSEDLGDRRGQARALRLLAHLAVREDRYADGEALGQASLTIARELDDRAMIAASLDCVTEAARGRGEPERARRLGEEALVLRRQLGDDIALGHSLVTLAHLALDAEDHDALDALSCEAEGIARRLGAPALLDGALWVRGAGAALAGDGGTARPLLEECLLSAEQAGSDYDVAWCRLMLADVAAAAGDLESARCGYEGALAVAARLNDRYMEAWSLRGLSRVACAEADEDAAKKRCLRALVVADGIGDKPGLADAMEIMAGIAGREQDGARAARLLGAAERLRLEASKPVPRCHRAQYDATLALVRTALDPHAFERAWAEGRAMGRADYVAAAGERIDDRSHSVAQRATAGSGSR